MAKAQRTNFYFPGGTDVPVADGGTGVSTLTGVVIGNGTSAFSAKTNPTGAFGDFFHLFTNWTSGNPAQNTTYCFGVSQTIITTFGTVNRYYMPRAGTLRRARIHYTVGATLGTTENSSLYFRKNNTTDTLLTSAVALNGRTYTELITGLNISMLDTDYFEFKWTTPTTWVTAPTAVTFHSLLEFQL